MALWKAGMQAKVACISHRRGKLAATLVKSLRFRDRGGVIAGLPALLTRGVLKCLSMNS